MALTEAQKIEKEIIRRELAERIWESGDRLQRLQSGIFYKIKNKKGKVVPYKPNEYQKLLQETQHNRNIILKARQIGFSTDIGIQAVDFAITNPGVNVGVIAHDKDSAEDIFRDKIKIAWDNLPKNIRDKFDVSTENVRELGIKCKKTGKTSYVKVATSFRGGTLQFLHISEFGKICAKYPAKAREIVTGAIEALDIDGRLFIESTAEGNEGYFYEYFTHAREQMQLNKELTNLDLKPYFFAWWENKPYSLPEDSDVVITMQDIKYFKSIEEKCSMKLTIGQKKRYIKKRQTQQDDMQREYPSFREEAFQLAVEGAYYKNQLELMRLQKRIGDFPMNPNLPVYVTRDLGGFGGGDEMATLFFQLEGDWITIIDYEEATGYSMEEYQLEFVTPKGYKIIKDFFPHDGKRTESNGKSVSQNAREIGVPVYTLKIGGIRDGINETKRIFHRIRINEQTCPKLIKSLTNYRRERDDKLGRFKDKPFHNWASHGADAFRYMPQALAFMGEGSRKVKEKRKIRKRNAAIGEFQEIYV